MPADPSIEAVQGWMALDLHIALGHLVDHESPYQGRRSWADWWADLCGEVRGMAAVEVARSHSTREEQDHG